MFVDKVRVNLSAGNGGNGVIHGQFEYSGRGFYKRILIRKKVWKL